jgi:hypothetical protein
MEHPEPAEGSRPRGRINATPTLPVSDVKH